MLNLNLCRKALISTLLVSTLTNVLQDDHVRTSLPILENLPKEKKKILRRNMVKITKSLFQKVRRVKAKALQCDMVTQASFSAKFPSLPSETSGLLISSPASASSPDKHYPTPPYSHQGPRTGSCRAPKSLPSTVTACPKPHTAKAACHFRLRAGRVGTGVLIPTCSFATISLISLLKNTPFRQLFSLTVWA